jgi:hypothetical protein
MMNTTMPVRPLYRVTQEFDRSGDRGFSLYSEGDVVDELTGRNLLPGIKVNELNTQGGAQLSVATQTKPTLIAYVIRHRDGLVLPLDILDLCSAFYVEDARLADLKWISSKEVSWERKFLIKYAYQENGGYQAKYKALPVTFNCEKPYDGQVCFPVPAQAGKKLENFKNEIEEALQAGVLTMTDEQLFHFWNQKPRSVFISKNNDWIKIEILSQQLIYWLSTENFKSVFKPYSI